MSTVNIPSHHHDPSYRYKMPRVKTRTEGRGNGVKTNLLNMSEICKTLKRNPEYCTKFCGCELGAMAKFDSAQGVAIVNGIHSENDVLVVIDKFIERFVLCPKCRLPEVDLGVADNKVVGTCNACGFDGLMDNTHKVATYICRYPPNNNNSSTVKKGKCNQKFRTNKDVDLSDDACGEDSCGNDFGDDDGMINNAAREKESKEERRKRHQQRKQERLEHQADQFKTHTTILEEFKKQINPDDSFDKVIKVVDDLKNEKGFKNAERLELLLGHLFSGKTVVPSLLTTLADDISKLRENNFDERSLLKALEHLAIGPHPDIFENYAVICYWFYDNDYVSESEFLRRYSGVLNKGGVKSTEDRAKMARRSAAFHAAKFITWLEEAESASSSDEEAA